jgi:transcriptional regulator with XRE-family HTH domain
MAGTTDEELLKLVGQRIRELRKEKGMSLQDLAYQIGMEKSNLSVIENGKSNPQLLTYARIASALGTSLSYLLIIEFDFTAFNEAPVKYIPRKHG